MKPLATARRQVELLAGDPPLAVLVGLLFLFLAVFVAWPLAAVLARSFQNVQGAPSLENYLRFLRYGYLWSALWNSLLVAAATAAAGVVLGYAAAFALARTKIRAKKLLHILFILPVISPPFTSALATLMLLGANGLITRRVLGIANYNIYGLKGVILSQVFTFAPVAYLTLRGVLDSLNPTLEDAAHERGRRPVADLPEGDPAPEPAGHRQRLPRGLHRIPGGFREPPRPRGQPLPHALHPGLPRDHGIVQPASGRGPGRGAHGPLGDGLRRPALLAPETAVHHRHGQARELLVEARFEKRPGPPQRVRLRLRGLHPPLLRNDPCRGLHPGVGIQPWADAPPFTYAFGVGVETICDTLVVALLSTPLSGLMGMLIAFLVVRVRFPGKGAMEFVSILNFAVPGTVVGIGYILAFNRPPLLLIGTLSILVLNFVFRYVPVGIQSGIAVLRQIDPSIEEAARNLGADGLTTFRKVTLPLIAPAFFSGLVFAFVRAMTAISAAIFLVSARWNLLTVQILNQVARAGSRGGGLQA